MVRTLWCSVLPLAFAVGGCGGKPEPAGDVAARVNDATISVSQVDAAVARSEGMSPDQLARARSAVLETLIDEELMVQKARDRGLEREPRVGHAIERARRDILARAYLDQVAAVDARPAEEAAVRAFYAAHPALFAARRIYTFHEFNVRARPERFESVRAIAARERSVDGIVAALSAAGLSFASSISVLPAEQLPFDRLQGFADLKDGENLMTRTDEGVSLVHLLSSQPQPLDELAARPVIQQFLANRQRLERVREEAVRLRKVASIEYVGAFARGAAATVEGAAPAAGEGDVMPSGGSAVASRVGTARVAGSN